MKYRPLFKFLKIDDELDPNDVDVKRVENHILFKIARYGFENPTFTLNEITRALKLSTEDRNLMESYVNAKIDGNPSKMIICIKPNVYGGMNHDGPHCLTPEALFAFMDYIELKQSREHSRRASRQSRQAINISMWALIISAIVGLAQILIGFIGLLR